MGHSKRKHYDFAPSASYRWLNCPGSVSLSKKAPPEKDNIPAMEGTLAHEVLEFLVRRYSNLDNAAKEALKKFKANKLAQKYSWDVAAMVNHGVASAKIIYSLKPSKGAKLLIEQKVFPASSDPGTLDYSWVELWNTLVVIDYKYGFGFVAPQDEDTKEHNPQLMTYGSGIGKKYDYEFTDVKLVIIQPRIWETPNNWLEAKATIGNLRAFEKRAKVAVEQGKLPNPPFNAATPDNENSWCKYCPAGKAGICKAFEKMKTSSEGIAFAI